MIKKTISYTDYNGNQREEDFYFNLNKAEVVEMEISAEGNSLADYLKKIVAENNGREVMAHFKEIILKSYGVKTPDGKRFVKSDAISDEFVQSEAYAELIMELLTKENFAAEFINGLLPADLVKDASETARERSEKQMQGFLKKDDNKSIEVVKDEMVEDLVGTHRDLSQESTQKPLSPEEIEELKRRLAKSGVQL